MRKIVLLLGLCLCLILPSLALAADQQPDAKEQAQRMQAAQKYWKIAEVQDQINDMGNRFAAQFPKEQQKEFLDRYKAFFDKKRMESVKKRWVATSAQIFTAKELEAMVNFFGSPEGISIRQKMPLLGKANNEIIGGELNQFIKQEQARMAAEQAKEAAKAAKEAPAKDDKAPAPKKDKAEDGKK